MNTERDPLARLRAANPLPEPVDQPRDDLLQEILMTTTDTPTPAETTSGPAPKRRLPVILAAAAALLVVAGIVGALANGGDDAVDDDQIAGPALDDPALDDPGDAPSGGQPVDPGASGPAGDSQVTSCVESYSPETLRTRDYAFDGTVASVEGQQMTFTVNEWFSAGEGDTITLDHQGYAGMLLDPNTALEPGTRALVAGSGGFVWSCGFTQLWTEAGVEEWRSALAG